MAKKSKSTCTCSIPNFDNYCTDFRFLTTFFITIFVLGSFSVNSQVFYGHGHGLPISFAVSKQRVNSFRPSSVDPFQDLSGFSSLENGLGFGSTGGQDIQTLFYDLFNWNYEFEGGDWSCDVPDLTDVSKFCNKKDFFYGGNPNHRRAIRMVGQTLMNSNARDAVCMAGVMRDSSHMNPNVWLRGVMAVVLSKPDMRDLKRPTLVQIMPGLLINNGAMEAAKMQSHAPTSVRECVPVNGLVGRDNGRENILWYFREDVMINAHHWYWHLIYPFETNAPRPDRRGELFYYAHHGILARYHAERLSNGLPATVPLFLNYGNVIEEPYYTHLDDTNSGNQWTDRFPNARISDIMSDAVGNTLMNISLGRRVEHLRRIEESVLARTLLAAGGNGGLDGFRGIDLLGDVVESSVYSVNREYYGNDGVHNNGHIILALIQDPFDRFGLPPGVMGDTATSIRDPVFYRYHATIDAIFDLHKHTLPPYQPADGDFPLLFQGIKISSFGVVSKLTNEVNKLTTFWNYAQYDLARGLDFNRSNVEGPINACVKHIDHQDFEYKIMIEQNHLSPASQVSVRIFLAPRFDESGRRYTIYEQSNIFFPLDQFVTFLEPGSNLLTRKSLDSTLTIPSGQRLEELNEDPNLLTTNCGCGWPHHMLLPKGSKTGLVFDLFVMVTNAEEDAVRFTGQRSPNGCQSGSIYCGIPDQLYPDSKPMGYPFDRVPRPSPLGNSVTTTTLDDFVSDIPNMATVQVQITFRGEGGRSRGTRAQSTQFSNLVNTNAHVLNQPRGDYKSWLRNMLQHFPTTQSLGLNQY